MLRDAAKLTFGCTLVATEFFSTSTARSSLLTALTDLAGLTRGRVHQVTQALPSLHETVPDGKEASTTLVNEPATTVNGPSATTVTMTKGEETTVTLKDEQTTATVKDEQNRTTVRRVRRPRERPVPATPLSRMANFAGMGASLVWGTMEESMKRIWVGQGENQSRGVLSPFLSEKNAERLALGLCKMRGAALKLGQMLSIQDETIIPAPLLAALESVRQGADVMPKKQLHAVLVSELGPDWRERLESFEEEPMAAASIGQVHRATLRGGQLAVMKIQYPGVAESIDSDIDNLKWFLDRTNLLPRGLYLDQAIKVAKSELAMECDYRMEAHSQKKFKELLATDNDFYVPVVYDDLSSRRVLTTELVPGVPIDKVATMNQDVRNHVGSLLLKLTLKELFEFRFMQTDPNWSNFLFDVPSKRINLIDFGAARSYPADFVDNYLKMVMACADKEREQVLDLSIKLGFLTGEESQVMLDAHTEAAFVVGMPFAKAGGYDFKGTNLTARVSELGATMLRHRLKPPPDEVYSLHRKLSGAFLACIKLGAIVNCREMLLQVYEKQNGANMPL